MSSEHPIDEALAALGIAKECGGELDLPMYRKAYENLRTYLNSFPNVRGIRADLMDQVNKINAVENVISQCNENPNGEFTQYTRQQWRDQIENGDTDAGYWEWVLQMSSHDEVAIDTLTPSAAALPALR